MNDYVKIRVSTEEKAEIEAEALLRGMTMNAVLRERLFADKQRMDLAFSYAENIAEIRDNLNQLMIAPVQCKVVFIDDLLKINDRLAALEEQSALFMQQMMRGGVDNGYDELSTNSRLPDQSSSIHSKP